MDRADGTISGTDAWHDLAKRYREALAVIRPGEYPKCLPGEAESCGGSNAQHVMASGALIAAMTLHHAEHAGSYQVQQFWDLMDGHRITLQRHHGAECDCAESLNTVADAVGP
jgi:hypothetical protein